MSPIRPPIFPPNPQPAQQAPAPARNAAQRAFFEAAAGRTAVAAQAQAPTARTQPQAQAALVQRMPASLPADPPERILRPGSILDIRV